MADDISRWLRRVRPSTTADEGWSTSSEADQVLAAIHRRTSGVERRGSALTRRGRAGHGLYGSGRAARLLPAAVLAATAAAVVAIAMTTTSSSGPTDHGFAQSHGAGPVGVLPPLQLRPASYLLSTESSCADLLAQLRSHTASTVTKYGYVGAYGYVGTSVPANGAALGDVPAPAASNGLSASSQSSGGTSTTNDQEQGVDEPDIVKTDGNTIVTITDGVLRVLDASTRAVTGSLDLSMYTGYQGAQLLVHGSSALVILSDTGGPVVGGPIAAGGAVAVPSLPGGVSGVGQQTTDLFVNLSGQPTVTGSLRTSGGYLDARLLGSTVRLVVRSAPMINLPQTYPNSGSSTAANEKAVRSAPLSDWAPKYTVTDHGASKTSTVPCNRISHPSDFTGTSMLTIYTLDMGNLGADPSPVTVAADGDTVYANSSSLYVASNPQWFCCANDAKQDTEVHRFDITGTGAPTYLGSGVVPGRLLSSYSLSDDGGYLRVATTTSMGGSSQDASNSIYVLADNTLTITGHVGGLGQGERIYAVRFMGPIAYVVTYQQTDPLYVVDLHEPAAPKVLGSLQVSGVSTYLHDVGNGRLVGVGQQLTAGEGSGVQVSLFDVSTASALKRVDNVTVPNTGWYLRFDPHTFLYWQPTGLIVVPLQSWSGSESGRALALRLDGQHLRTVGILANPRPAALPDDRLGIQRSLIVDGNLWTVSGGGVQVSDQSDLHRISWIAYQ